MPSAKSLTEQNAAEVPLYTTLDVARYLRVSVWVVLSCTARHPDRVVNLLEQQYRRDWQSPVRFVDDYGPAFQGEETQRISFRALAALFVASPILRLMFWEDSIRWPPRAAIQFRFEAFEAFEAFQHSADDSRLFTDPDWVLNCFDRIPERIYGLTREPERGHLLKLIALHQARVEVRDGVPVRVLPFSREPAPDTPRAVVIDPEVRFGRPTVKGVPTDVLAERWRAGDGAAELADDYGLTTEEVEESLRYEALPFPALFLFPFPPAG